MTYILHLGLPKTATTSLQKDVFPRLPGIMLSLREQPGPAALLEQVRYRAQDATALAVSEARYLAELRRRFRNAPPGPSQHRTILVSNENVIGPHPDGPAALIHRIKAVCPDARVMITLREPVDFLRSIFRQELDNLVSAVLAGTQKPVKIKSFDSFIRRSLTHGVRGHLAFVHHTEIVDALHACFGRENVLTLRFDMLKTSQVNFLNDLFAFVGCAPKASVVMGRRNRSRPKIEELLVALKKAPIPASFADQLASAYDRRN
jgi:hypothetical protein